MESRNTAGLEDDSPFQVFLRGLFVRFHACFCVCIFMYVYMHVFIYIYKYSISMHVFILAWPMANLLNFLGFHI